MNLIMLKMLSSLLVDVHILNNIDIHLLPDADEHFLNFHSSCSVKFIL